MGARPRAEPRFSPGNKRGKKLAVWGLTASVLGYAFGPAISGLCIPAHAQESERSGRRYLPPVDGPVTRRYEEPPGPYAAGHRGIDYGVPAGTTVKASNNGTVIFAGPVGGDGLFVTLRHPDGLETLYSYLSRIDVAAGSRVERANSIGASGQGHPGEGKQVLHFAVKENGEYIDPELVLDGDSNNISDALALLPVEEGAGDEEGSSQEAGSQEKYLGTPPGAGPGFTTHPDRNGARSSGGKPPSGSRANRTAGYRGARGSGQQAGAINLYGDGGFSGDGSQGSSWEQKRDRIGRFLAGEPEPSLASRQAVERAKAEENRRARQRATKSISDSARHRFDVFVKKASRAAREWTTTQFRRVASFMLSRWDKFKLWLAQQADHVGNFLQPLPDQGLVVALPGLVSGLFHQVGCSLRGGDPPPKMPTAQQFKTGEVKPPPAPSDNLVMVLGGLGSSSTEKDGRVTGHASLFDMDFRTLGFKEEQIYHYSYKGVEKRGGTGPYRLHAPYAKTDTYKSLKASAEALDEQIKAVHRSNPKRRIDLVAHSEGGLVADYFVSHLYRPTNPNQPQVEHLVTLNTPHQGADLARLGELFTETATGRLVRRPVEGFLGRVAGAPPATAPVLNQVEEDSTFIRQLRKSHDGRKVKTTTIATALDWIVTAPHSRLAASETYTTDLDGLTFSNFFKAHSQAATAQATKGLAYNALANRKSQCTAFRNSFAQYVSGPTISNLEDGAIHLTQAQFYVTDWWASLGGNSAGNRIMMKQ